MKKDFCETVIEELPIEYACHKFICDDNNRPYDWETWEVLDGKVLYASPSCERISGYAAEEFIKDKGLLEKIILDEDKHIWERHRREVKVNIGVHSEHFRIKNKNGKVIWIEHTCSAILTAKGAVLGYKSNNRDTTPLKESEEKYRLLFENTVETIMVIQDKKIKMNNPIAETLTGYHSEELLEMTFLELIYKEDLEVAECIHKSYLRGYTGREKVQIRIVRKDKKVRWIESYGIQVVWNNRAATLIFAIDITDSKEAEDALKASEEKYRFLTEYASDVIWVQNISKNKVSYISPAIYQLTGFTVEEVMAKTMEEVITPKSLKVIRDSINANVEELRKDPKNPQTYIDEVQQPCKNGGFVWVEVSTKYIYNSQGDIEVIGVSRNINERKKIEEEIRYLSYYDQLTGLYNRRFYEEELSRINIEENLPITLIMADVNGLKLTNDAFGHRVGDKLLKKISEILKNESGNEGIVARMGGDEFVMLLPRTSIHEGEEIVSRIKERVNNTTMDEVILSISFGCATKTHINEDMETVFACAENSMYRRKLLESKNMKSKTIKLITKSLHEKDFREENHGERVSNICKDIGIAMGLTANEVNDLELLGLLHDIGKIGISEKTLNKTGKLNSADWKVIKRHPEIGYQILRAVNEFAHIAEFVLCHHERLDGKGYPRGLKGNQIPLPSRILSVAGAYDSMINGNGNKKGISKQEAIKELLKNVGTQFDEEVVKWMVAVTSADEVG